jgi:hypothetical protein
MGKRLDDRDYLENAMAALADLEGMCKVLLLRVEQIERRAPALDGLVSPMPEQIIYIMRGIRKAQQAHAALWAQGFMK